MMQQKHAGTVTGVVVVSLLYCAVCQSCLDGHSHSKIM